MATIVLTIMSCSVDQDNDVLQEDKALSNGEKAMQILEKHGHNIANAKIDRDFITLDKNIILNSYNIIRNEEIEEHGHKQNPFIAYI